MKLLVLAVLTLAAIPVSAQPVDLIIFAGQSNAEGYGANAMAYPRDPKSDDAILLYTTSWSTELEDAKRMTAAGWTTLGPQSGRFPRGHFGPEVTFARLLLTAKRRPAIFKYTVPAASLPQVWREPGDGGHFDRMVSELADAIAQLENRGEIVRVRGVIWLQGESDSQWVEESSQYKERMRRLIDHLRHISGNPRLPFVLSMNEMHPFVVKNRCVVEAQQELAAEQPQTVRWVSMRGLPRSDAAHLNSAGVIGHGSRLYRALASVLPARD